MVICVLKCSSAIIYRIEKKTWNVLWEIEEQRTRSTSRLFERLNTAWVSVLSNIFLLILYILTFSRKSDRVRLVLLPTWITSYIIYKVLTEITYPLQTSTVQLLEIKNG